MNTFSNSLYLPTPSIVASVTTPLILSAAGIVVVALISVVLFSFYSARRPTWKTWCFAALPSGLALLLFYSLAIHVRLSLGGWPQGIGERGFSEGLVAHVQLTIGYFSSLLQSTLLLWPVVFLVCLLVRPWRRGTLYLGVHVLAFTLCIGLMQLAPSAFLRWWRD